MERKRKADEAWTDERKISKKIRTQNTTNTCSSNIDKGSFPVINYFIADIIQILPREILQIVLFYGDPLSNALFACTSKHYNHSLSILLNNKTWHEIYLYTRKRFKNNIAGTILDQVKKSAHGWGGPTHAAVFEWDFEIWDHPLTSDCPKIQQDLIAEDDEDLAKYPLKYFFDESTYTCDIGNKDNFKYKKYDETVDYKRLAIKFEMRHRQFELWRESKPPAEAFHNVDCSCVKDEHEIALYDEEGAEIAEFESKLDLIPKSRDAWYSTAQDLLADSKDYEDGWDDNDSRSETVGDREEDRSDEDMTEKHEYDDVISVEQRDQLFADMAASEQSLKIFIHVLSAIVLGHCPAPSCHDSVVISTAKYEHTVVRTGDVVDEVMKQLKYATTLSHSSCISTMVCALQKLRVSDLLFLKQGAEEKYPYFSAVYSVLQVEENISQIFYMADRSDTFNFDENVTPWSSYFQADIATDDDFETMPDWLSSNTLINTRSALTLTAVRHSIHRLMRKAGVASATPNATEFAVHKLYEFVHRTLEAVVAKKSTENEENYVEVKSDDILKTLEKHPNQECRTALYTDNTELFYENPIVLHSDSEDFSDESSVDSDWVDEPITDLDEGDADDSEDIDYTRDEPLHGVLIDTLQKCVKHAQLDAEEYPDDDEISKDEDRDALPEDSADEEDSVETRITDTMNGYWEYVTDGAPGNDDKTAYYMPKTLYEEAVYYTGQELVEEDPETQAFIAKYKDDIHMHDMPDDERNKILDLRRQANQMIKEQCADEFKQYLATKFNRMDDNVRNYDSSIRSDANECKTMIVDLIENESLRETIANASQIIRSNSVLNSIKLMNFCHFNDKDHALIQLMADIEASPSIESIVISNCYFKSYAPLTSVVRNKKIKRFQLGPSNYMETEGFDELLAALQGQSSITDLMLPLGKSEPNDTRRKKYLNTVLSLLPQLDTLRMSAIWLYRTFNTPKDEEDVRDKLYPTVTDTLKQQLHQLKQVVLYSSSPYLNYGVELFELLESLKINYVIKIL